MALALASLENDIYTTFRAHLITGTYALSSITYTQQVTPVYSDNTAAKYGFPIIEIGKPIISNINTDRFGDVVVCDCTLPIVVVEDNSADSKTTCDDVRNKILTGKSSLKSKGVYKIRILSGSTSIVNKNKKNYHFTTISVNFQFRERIT